MPLIIFRCKILQEFFHICRIHFLHSSLWLLNIAYCKSNKIFFSLYGRFWCHQVLLEHPTHWRFWVLHLHLLTILSEFFLQIVQAIVQFIYALWFYRLDISAVVRSIGEAQLAGNNENKWHLVGDNLAALVAWSFILLSIIQNAKLKA